MFVVKDKYGKKVRLTKERWSHIVQEHPDISDPEEIKETLIEPTAVRASDNDPQHVKWFYRLMKAEKLYLLVSVKYLNGDGFIITAHYTKKIK